MRALQIVLALALLLILVAAVFVLWSQRSEFAAIEPPQRASFDNDLIKKGANLAAIGNCDVCHTVPGGAAYAGSRPIPTPFGTIYSTNITPDPETGIGHWSEEAFSRAMCDGIARNGDDETKSVGFYALWLVNADIGRLTSNPAILRLVQARRLDRRRGKVWYRALNRSPYL